MSSSEAKSTSWKSSRKGINTINLVLVIMMVLSIVLPLVITVIDLLQKK